mmetsp:Transcript_21480/g.24685  ORF Transcript_21480/g.24685 Transcript_21480/m.24685 type:complete len:84 (+) Transcript_21480:589-840(+)
MHWDRRGCRTLPGRPLSVVVSTANYLRKCELKWLRAMMQSFPFNYVLYLTSHRGFHNYSDRSDITPIENSLSTCDLVTSSFCG